MLPGWLIAAFVTASGLVLGSFLNVCIHRLPLGESLVQPASRCPKCGRPVRWYENIPLLSYLVLRGRCAGCGVGISLRYPFVELIAGVIAFTAWQAYGLSAGFFIIVGFGYALTVLFFTDYDHHLLPDVVTLTGFVTGLAVAWFSPFLGRPDPWHRVWMSLAGAALGAGVLWGIGAFYTRLRGVEAMGMGDVKMMAMVGAFTGPVGVLITIFGGSIAGALFGVARIPFHGGSMKDTLPFGCFLAPAAAVALLYGQRLFTAYYNLIVPGG